MKRFLQIFCIGGGLYNVIEWLWRGYSHWSMFVVGGTCFHMIGAIGARWYRRGKLLTALVCSVAVTAVEYVSGCVLNRRLKLGVWDYSKLPLNIGGQVCLLYSVLWGGLSLLALPIYRKVKGKVI